VHVLSLSILGWQDVIRVHPQAHFTKPARPAQPIVMAMVELHKVGVIPFPHP
jgi:hypothetical protein